MSYAGERIFDLFNVADHVAQLARNAEVAEENGDWHAALTHLEHAERSAGQVQLHLRDAIAALKKAAGR